LREALPARNAVAKVKHHPALPYAELPEFMAKLEAREGISARALELTILTAARTSEVTGATWSEFDLEGRVWVVPAGRMKASKEHRVPLCDRAVALLKALPREGKFVFPGAQKNTAISNMSMAAVLKRMGVKPEVATVHGFRSTFRDWAAERTAYPHEVVEMALAHAIKNKVEAAYRRGDLFEKRARLMAEWGKYATTCSSGEATVTAIRKAT
jgi:integrase